MKRPDSPLVVDGGEFLSAVAADVPLFPAFPARSVFDVDCWVRALELLVFLAAVGAFAKSFRASPSPTVGGATWVAPVARIPSIPLDECDEVVSRHRFEIWLLLGLFRWSLVFDAMKRKTLLLEKTPGGLRPDHVAESDVWARVGGTPQDALAEGAWEDVEEIRLFLLIARHGTAQLRVLLQPELELSNADGDGLEILDGLEMLRFHLTSHLLQLDGLAVVDVPDNRPPSVDALQVVGATEDSLSLCAQAVAQEAPDLVVEAVHQRGDHCTARLVGDLHEDLMRN